MSEEWRTVDRLAAALGERLGDPPRVLLVLGSGLGSVADALRDRRSVDAADLPGWPRSTVAGHAGQLHRGSLGGAEVLIQQGRAHLYEGYAAAEVVRPVRAAITWGAGIVLITNAAGGIDPALVPGQLMLIDDHLNLTGQSPLVGPNDDTRGDRFPALNDLYDPQLRALARERAAAMSIPLGSGVYAGNLGPTYETPAEVRMLAALGAGAVGMSTVLEAIAAHHLGAKVLGFSCISNPAAGLGDTPPTHDEVQLFGKRAAADLARLLPDLVPRMQVAS